MNFQKIIYYLTKNWPFFGLIILIIPTFVKILGPGFFPMQDDIQAFRLHQMDKCFKDFQIPCRWVPDAGFGYGYPQFEYYPPSVYYLGEIFHLIGFQFIDVVKILFILGFLTSAIFMYLFLRVLLGVWPAFFGSLLYTYVPYRAVEVYVRGAMNEFWALSIFPLIFWFSLQLIKTGQIKYIAWFAVSIGFLLTTHNLMTVIFAPIALVWILSLLILEKKLNNLPKILLGGVLGLGLAAFFSLPVFFEKQYAHLETLIGGYFDYRQHFANIKQLFFSNDWGYGSSFVDPKNQLNLSTGIVHWILGVVALIMSFFFAKKDRKIATLTLILAVMVLGVLFMIHQKSSFIWTAFESLLIYLQFPWRFLSVSIFLLSILGAIVIYYFGKFKLRGFNLKKLMITVGCLIAILVFLLHGSFFTPKEWLNISDVDKFSGKSWEKQVTISIFDYLPIYAKFPPIQKAPDVPEVLEGEAEFINYKKGSNFQEGEAKIKESARIRLPLFDFPGMKVWVNGKLVKHINNDCTNQEFCQGLITFDLPIGTHRIKAQLTNTPVRTVGNLLTLISMIVVGYLLVKDKLDEKNLA